MLSESNLFLRSQVSKSPIRWFQHRRMGLLGKDFIFFFFIKFIFTEPSFEIAYKMVPTQKNGITG